MQNPFDNSDSTDHSEALTVRGLIAKAANIRHDAPAMLAPGRQPLTYSQLLALIDSTVRQLNEIGIGRNDRVAVVLENGPELAVAFAAISAGATFAPLNPAYREGEFDFFLADMKAKALLVEKGKESAGRAVAQRLGIAVIELIPERDQPAGVFRLESPPGLPSMRTGYSQTGDIALVLHTSGTTSRPKCVPLTHTNVCASARNVGNVLALVPEDRCLNIMPLFHIHGLIAATLASLAAGASIVATPGFHADQFYGWLNEFRPTWYTAVPTMHQAILAEAAKQSRSIAQSQLRLIRSSSAALAPQLLHQLEQSFRAPVLEAYGMTEAAHQMCSNPLPPAARKAGSVGRPAGPDVSVMDADGNLLSAHMTGELVIRGENIMSGYERQSDNESAFSCGWFRTGDQGYFDDDGYFYLTGRIKELINRGGEKISPREIDEALSEHPAVTQAVAFAVPHASLGEDVAAAVILMSGSTCTEAALREFAFSKLAEFKVPSRIVLVDSIPKGPTGKLQRIGLHKLLAPLLKAEFADPIGSVEIRLAAMWKDLLDLARVGRSDNFFLCGGDSLVAARLNARIESEFGVALTLPQLFRQPRLHAQAAAIEDAMRMADQAVQQELTQVLEELESLTDEEAAELLAEEQRTVVSNRKASNPS